VRSAAQRLIAELGAHVVQLKEERDGLEVMLKAPVKGFYPTYRLEKGELLGVRGVSGEEFQRPVSLEQLARNAADTSRMIDEVAVGWLTPFADVVRFDAARGELTIGTEVYRLEAGKLVDRAGVTHEPYDLRAVAGAARLSQGTITRAQLEALAQEVGWGVKLTDEGRLKVSLPDYYLDHEYAFSGDGLELIEGRGARRLTLDELRAVLKQRNAAYVTEGLSQLDQAVEKLPASLVQRIGPRELRVTAPLRPEANRTFRLEDDGLFHDVDNGGTQAPQRFTDALAGITFESVRWAVVRPWKELYVGSPKGEPAFDALATFQDPETKSVGIGQADGAVRWLDLGSGRIIDRQTGQELTAEQVAADLDAVRARRLEHLHSQLDGPLAQRPWVKFEPADGTLKVGLSEVARAWGNVFRNAFSGRVFDLKGLLAEVDKLKPLS
jgi:hypothetical protein